MKTRRFDLHHRPGRRRARRAIGAFIQIAVTASACSATAIGLIADRTMGVVLVLPIALTWFLVGNLIGQAVKGTSPEALRRQRAKGGVHNEGRFLPPGGIDIAVTDD